MTDILMIKVTDTAGNEWSLNLNYVVAVEYAATGPVTNQTQITNDRLTLSNGKVIQLPPGLFVTAVGDLLTEFNMGQRIAAQHIYIGGAP